MKSKFLQNSKDLLSRKFNPIKCKTSLRLVGARLKLLRNKKLVQLKQMRKEISQLLESGQDQTARIRVEHVIREEKMMAAYDLLEIYCELIIARLPIIESQKECPIDLKEAIASVVFSSPRCGDVPELLDVRKQFSAKYGKEFVAAATELRPICGVARLLVEKLSAGAPDGETKFKMLNAIAEEHNVKWEDKSFEEKVSVGPISIQKESELHAENPPFEAADDQARPSYDMHDPPLNLAQQDARISPGKENLYTKIKPEERPSGTCSSSVQVLPPSKQTFTSSNPGEKMPQLLQENGHNSHLDSPKWDMEFNDAASAAKAAAESAERASMAAKAAAELATHGRILTQFSTEPHNPDVHIVKTEGPTNLNSLERNSEASVDTVLESAFVEGCEDSLKEEAGVEMDIKRHSFVYETETLSSWQKKAENLREGEIVKKSISISEDVNIFADFENDEIQFHGEAPQTSYHESDGLLMNKSDSDVDNHTVDKGPIFDEQDSWTSTNIFATENSSPDVSENTTLRDVADLDNFTPLAFDESRGSSDEDVNAYKVHEIEIEQHSNIDSKQPSLYSDDDNGITWNTNIFVEDSSENFTESKDFGDESSSERLDFGKLTGGLRHKANNRLSFFKNNGLVESSVKKKEEDAPSVITSSTSSVEHPKFDALSHHQKSSNYESEEETLQESSPKMELNFGAYNSNYYSDDSDLEDDFPNVSTTRKNHLKSGISRRTKASPSTGEKSKNYEQATEESYDSTQPETAALDKICSNKDESLKEVSHVHAESSCKISLCEDESPKKASHVHPKLPDYDSLVHSLRINRS